MRLLERDVHDKQDTLMLLRQQLEEVKKINTEFHIKQKVLILCTHVIQIHIDIMQPLYPEENM